MSLVWIALPAFAQQASPVSAPVAPMAVVATAPAAVDATSPAADPDAILLGAIRKQVDIKKAKAEELGVDIQIQDSRTKLDGGTSAGNSTVIPDLIGLYGTDSRMTAEFIVGGTSVLTARRGEWVTADWQLESMLSNGVVLKRRDSKERRTVLFGRRSAPGTLSAAGGTSYAERSGSSQALPPYSSPPQRVFSAPAPTAPMQPTSAPVVAHGNTQ
ncbi:MAG: hypothetical protein ABIW82_17170 [Dokdonella sp.]